MIEQTKLKWQDVRWQCDAKTLGFKTTEEVEPVGVIVGQDDALDALRFAIECGAYGQNVYVRGLSGTGRMSMVSKILNEARPQLKEKTEHCYVANFQQPDRPKLISLPAGQGSQFKEMMQSLSIYFADELQKAMESETLLSQKNKAEEKLQSKIKKLTDPFEKELGANSLAMINVKTQQGQQTIVAPKVNDEVLDPNLWQQKVAAGEIPTEQQESLMKSQQDYSKKLEDLGRKINEVREQGMGEISDLLETYVNGLIDDKMKAFKKAFKSEQVFEYLAAVKVDLVDQFFYKKTKNVNPRERYAVNLLLPLDDCKDCPVIVERVPSLQNLLGSIESKWGENGPVLADHLSISRL